MSVFPGIQLFLFCVLVLTTSTKGDLCTTPYGEDGECVNIKTCKSLMAIVKKQPMTDIDHFILKSHAEVCTYKNQPYSACCPISERPVPQTTTTTTLVPPIEKSCIVGHCVKIQNCSVLYNIAINTDITQEDTIYLKDKQCKSNDNSFSVCCPDDDDKVPIISDAAGQVCKTPRGVPGACLDAADCLAIAILLRKDPSTQEEMEFLDKSRCDNSDRYCCPTVVSPVPEAETPTTTDLCTTPYGEDGECVNIKTCKSLMAIVKKQPMTDIDHFILKSHAEVCTYKNQPYSACCPISERPVPQTTTTTTLVPPIDKSCIVGHCVKIQNCSVLYNIAINTDITQEDTIYLKDKQCKSNDNSFSVCCPDDDDKVPIISDAAGQVCKTPRGVPGTCLDAADCLAIAILLRKDPSTQEEMEFLDKSRCDNSDRYCCPTVVSPVPEAETPTTTAAPIVEKCETPNGANGTCISVIHCESLLRVLQKPDFFENDAKYLNASFCGDGAKFPKVCCPEALVAEELSLPLPPYCGVVFPAENYFDAGSITSSEEYPWTALLLYTKMGKTRPYCGGTLIHKRFVLTAAHCLYENEPEWTLTGVRLGVWATMVMQDCKNQALPDQIDCESISIDLAVSKVIKHPEYESLYNDLALLQLVESVHTTRYVAPICLPFETEHLSASFNDDKILQISGWGAHLFEEVAEFKMKSIVHISSLEQFKDRFLTEAGINLTAKHVCVKDKAVHDNKILDSGGALMSPANIGKMQSYFLLGVEAISYEIPPKQGFPFIFTRISPYLDWIKREIREN